MKNFLFSMTLVCLRVVQNKSEKVAVVKWARAKELTIREHFQLGLAAIKGTKYLEIITNWPAELVSSKNDEVLNVLNEPLQSFLDVFAKFLQLQNMQKQHKCF